MSYRFIFRDLALIRNMNVIEKQCFSAFHSSTYKSSKNSPLSFKKIMLGVSLMGVSGGVYGYMTAVPERNKRNYSTELVELTSSYVLQEPPTTKPSRQVDGPAKDIGLNLKLFQYQTCPFCCKVRTFLDYYGLPYDVIEVNPLMKQQIKFSRYRKVPILVAHEEKSDTTHQLNDSSVITSILGTYLLKRQENLDSILKFYVPVTYENEDGKKVTEVLNQYFLMYERNNYLDKTENEIVKERQWRKWADQEFVHVLSPNVYRTKQEALEAFNYYSKVGEWDKNFSKFEKLMAIYVGATAMYFIGKRLKKKYGLKDNVRESLYDAGRVWAKAIGSSKFLGGNNPNLADLAVYGMLNSIEGTGTFRDLAQNTKIGPWYYRVQEAVNTHQGYYQIHSK